MIGAKVFDRLLIPSIAPCPIGTLLGELDKESASNLTAAMAINRTELSHAAIARSIREEAGRPVSPETVSAHRNGDCRCSTL